jgi:hypothetical protein
MRQLANPSITSPRQGDRSRASRVSPGNMTGRIYAQQHAEEDARKATSVVDVAAIRDSAWRDGFAQGWDRAIAWVIDHMIDAGIDPDILVVADEDQGDDEQGDAAGDGE